MEESRPVSSTETLATWHPFWKALVYGMLYYAAGIIAESMMFKPQGVMSFCLTGGLCFAVLLLLRPREWLWFLGATLLADALVEITIFGHGYWIGLVQGGAYFLQAAVGVFLLQGLVRGPFSLANVRHVSRLAVVALCASVIGATAGWMISLWQPDGMVFFERFASRWLANVVGILVVAPVVLAWLDTSGRERRSGWRELIEVLALFAGLAATGFMVFGPVQSRYLDLLFPYPYILLPFLLWAAIRFDLNISATATLVLALMAAWYTSHGFGPFCIDAFPPLGHAAVLQVFVGVSTLFSYFPGAIISERRLALERVNNMNATLEQRVHNRTHALEESERRYRQFADDLEGRVQQRTVELSTLNEELKNAIVVRENIAHMLEDSTAMQRAILDSANASIISTEPDGTIRTVNATAERWLKYHGHELMGTTNLAILHDPVELKTRAALLTKELRRNIPSGFEAVVARAQTGGMDESEWFYTRKDGSRMPVALSVTALRDEKGVITGYLNIARDITERKLAEKALQESESNLSSFFNSASIMMGIIEIVGDDMVHISDNAAAARFFGMTPEAMRWRRASEIGALAQNMRIWISNFLKSERTGRPVRFEYSHRTQETTCQLSVTVAFIAVTPVGRVRFSYVAEDITERKRAQEALERFAAILEATTDFVGIADKSGRAIFINQAGRRILGWGENEDVTKFNIASFHTPQDRERVRQEGIPVAMIEGVWQAETTLVSRDGQREIPVSQVILAHKSAGGSVEFLSTIMRDMTERNQAEEKIRVSLEEKEILLKEIHHRVKNNMQVISSLLQLQSGYIKDPEALSMFQECRDRIKSMALIHERLYQSRDLAEIDFEEYVRSLVSMLIYSHRPRDIDVRSEIDIESVSLDLDTAIPIGLIVNELVINALKHAFAGRTQGMVFVGLRETEDGHCELVVRDDGSGLAAGFDFNASPSLGLRLVKILCKQIQGRLYIKGEQGTEFRIQFSKTKPHESEG